MIFNVKTSISYFIYIYIYIYMQLNNILVLIFLYESQTAYKPILLNSNMTRSERIECLPGATPPEGFHFWDTQPVPLPGVVYRSSVPVLSKPMPAKCHQHVSLPSGVHTTVPGSSLQNACISPHQVSAICPCPRLGSSG